MVRIKYSYLMRLLDAVDAKISDLQNDKFKEKKRDQPFNVAGLPDELTNDETISRFDSMIKEYEEIRDIINSELEHIEFEFGMRSKKEEPWKNNSNNQITTVTPNP